MSQRLPVCLCIALLLATGQAAAIGQASTAPTAPAGNSPVDADAAPVAMFASTCVRLSLDPAQLVQVLDSAGDRLDAQAAKPFLGEQPGKAWLTSYSGRPYAFTWQDRGLCSMFVRDGQPQALLAAFEAMGNRPPPGLSAQATRMRSDDGKRDMRQFVWSSASHNNTVVLVLSVDPAPDASLRALLSANLTVDGGSNEAR